MDIRSRPIEEWGRLLTERWPQPIAESVGWGERQGSAIVCVVIVMKMIIGYTDHALRKGESETDWVKAQGEAEGQNILLKYAWLDTSKGAVRADLVRRLHEEVYKELISLRGQWAQAVSKGVSFENLMESAPMLEHFWSRLELQKETGVEIEQGDGWMPLRPAIEAGSTVPMSASALAGNGLVRWFSVRESLEACLLRNPTRIDDQGREFQRVQGWSFGVQECIRILYDPGSDFDGPGFWDLLEVKIAPKVLETGQQGARWAGGGVQEYRLVAVVRLGTTNYPEYLRIYDKAGNYSVPKALSEKAALYLNDDWYLGQAGFRYMLYYVRAGKADPTVESMGEKPPFATKETVVAAIAESGHSGLGFQGNFMPPPLNAPTEPKADRERAAKKAKAKEAKKSGPDPNTMPLGRSRFAWAGDESTAGPSGDLGRPEGRSGVLDAPASQEAAKPKRFDPRRRSDQPGAYEGFRTSAVDADLRPRRTVGQPIEYDDMWRPNRKAKVMPQNPPAEPEDTSAQPARQAPSRGEDEAPGFARAWVKGASFVPQPDHTEIRERRGERSK